MNFQSDERQYSIKLNTNSFKEIAPLSYFGKDTIIETILAICKKLVDKQLCSKTNVTSIEKLQKNYKKPDKSIYPIRPSCEHLLCHVRRMQKLLVFVDDNENNKK